MIHRSKTIWRRLLNLPASQGTTATPDPKAERRAWARFPISLETTFRAAGDGKCDWLAATIRNISRGGINLLAFRAFEPGQLITVEMPGGPAEGRANILACVVHCEEEQPGEWSLGCNFSRELSDADLQRLWEKGDEAGPAELRESQRLACSIAATFQRVASSEQPPCPAKVLNISISGVGLLVDQSIENGALISLELHNAAGTVEKNILACVVHISRRPENQWALGCNFIRSLNEEDVQSLL